MKEELEQLQGAWNVVALEMDGAPQAESALRGSQIVVKGSAFTTTGMGAVYRGKLKIYARRTPRTLDLLFEEGPEKGAKSLGIYEIDQDTWRICLTVAAKDRPTTFATTAGSGLALETLRRHTGEEKKDILREKLGLLEGEWSMTSCERDGQPLPRAIVKTGKRLARGNETTVMFGEQVFLKAAYSVGPTNQPKTIDYLLTSGPNMGEYQYGIYEIKGDTARFCFAAPGRPRPTDFSTAGECGTLAVWKRRKK